MDALGTFSLDSCCWLVSVPCWSSVQSPCEIFHALCFLLQPLQSSAIWKLSSYKVSSDPVFPLGHLEEGSGGSPFLD